MASSGFATIAVLVVVGGLLAEREWSGPTAPIAVPSSPQVTVSAPLQQTVQATARLLGQFAAVDSVELRAQVGGTLSGIEFKDGQPVQAGDPLFTIDPRPL